MPLASITEIGTSIGAWLKYRYRWFHRSKPSV